MPKAHQPFILGTFLLMNHPHSFTDLPFTLPSDSGYKLISCFIATARCKWDFRLPQSISYSFCDTLQITVASKVDSNND